LKTHSDDKKTVKALMTYRRREAVGERRRSRSGKRRSFVAMVMRMLSPQKLKAWKAVAASSCMVKRQA
jgi:hypothetical protein